MPEVTLQLTSIPLKGYLVILLVASWYRNWLKLGPPLPGKVKVKSAYEPGGPSGRHLTLVSVA